MYVVQEQKQQHFHAAYEVQQLHTARLSKRKSWTEQSKTSLRAVDRKDLISGNLNTVSG